MKKLLYIESSPRRASTTTRVANVFLDAYRVANPASEIDVINVWREPLPAFDDEMIAAKQAVLRSTTATDEQRSRWADAVAVARRFNSADHYLFSVPMWNFSVPYRLKHYIDIATLPGENWMWSRETGYVSLLSGKQATVIYSSAGEYPLDPLEAGSDFQKPFLRRWLKFIGVHDVREINAAPTLAPADIAATAIDAAMVRARELAAET